MTKRQFAAVMDFQSPSWQERYLSVPLGAKEPRIDVVDTEVREFPGSGGRGHVLLICNEKMAREIRLRRGEEVLKKATSIWKFVP